MNQTLRSYRIWALALLVTALTLVFGFPSLGYYHQDVLLTAGINIVLAVSLNLINGFTGQFSLGHAGFMAVGAYVAASLTLFLLPRLGLGDAGVQSFFFLSLLSGGLAAALCGFLLGLPSLRLKGDYLAIVTLGFSEIIRVALLNLDVVKGARGLTGIENYADQYWIYFAVFLVAFCTLRFLGTPSGRAMFAVREDEIAAEAMGVHTTSVKVKAFVIGSFWAGVAGGLYAHKFGSINPASFSFMKSFEVVVIVVLGGLGSVSGAILAALGLTFLPELLRPLAVLTGIDFRMIIYSLILILFMLLRPNGLLGRHELSHYLARLWRKST